MKVRRFQMGGSVPQEDPGMAQQGAPGAEAGGMAPKEQLAQMAMEIIEQMGPDAAAMLAQMIMQVLEQSAGGGEPAGEPVYAKRGGRLVMVNRRRR